MSLLIARTPAPDVPYWLGRRLLAATDAVAWPAAFVAVVHATSQPLGIVGPLFVALAALAAARRVYRALLSNHRYRFTTCRWGRGAAAMLLIGALLKFLIT